MSSKDCRTYCSSCDISKAALMRLKPTERINLHDLNMDGVCRNKACKGLICSECFQLAWIHYDYVWDERDPGSYGNLEDDTLEEALVFEKKIVKCHKCTPPEEQPVYPKAVWPSSSSESKEEDYISPTSPCYPTSPSFCPDSPGYSPASPLPEVISEDRALLKRKLEEHVREEEWAHKRIKIAGIVCKTCYDDVCDDFSFVCKECKNETCLDCTLEDVSIGTQRVDIVCKNCSKN